MITAWACLIMGMASIIVSIYYSTQWFIQRGMPVTLAWTMAIIYVGFTNIIFEYGVTSSKQAQAISLKLLDISEKSTNYTKYKRLKWNNTFKSISQFICWVGLAAFSMLCTVGGQYDQLMEIEENKVEQKLTKDYTKQIEMAEDNLKLAKEELNQLLKINSSVDSVEKRWKYKNTTGGNQDRIDELKRAIEATTEKLELYYTKQQESSFKQSSGINERGFFNYLADITGNKYPPNIIQFYMALFPSIVIDIISPICLAIFIGSWKKRK